MFTGSDMLRLASQTETVVTVRPPGVPGIVKCADNNGLRWYIEFTGKDAASCPRIYPGKAPENVLGAIPINERQCWEWPKHLSLCTGEFYFFDDGTVTLFITEVVYKGP